MSELEDILGKELVAQIEKKIGQNKLIINDGKLIPKHRFDCINISLREHKEKCALQTREIEELKKKNNELLSLIDKHSQLISENYILKTLLEAKVIEYKQVRSLLKIEGLSYNTIRKVLNKRLNQLRDNEPDLFYEKDEMYVLVPYKKMIKRKSNE